MVTLVLQALMEQVLRLVGLAHQVLQVLMVMLEQ